MADSAGTTAIDLTDRVRPSLGRFPTEASIMRWADDLPGRGLAEADVWGRAAKRAMDVLVSVLLLVLVAPLLLLTALTVALTSPGSPIFVQERIGQNGRRFRIYKLRSMYRDAEQQLEKIANLNDGSGPVFDVRRDPLITPVGRIIRKLSVDELPQLLNVLLGHMSLVGPRPPLPSETEAYGPREWDGLRVRPGLTCIWQVSGRADLDFDTRTEMDLTYIRDWSLALDVMLLLRTIPAVLSGRGAY